MALRSCAKGRVVNLVLCGNNRMALPAEVGVHCKPMLSKYRQIQLCGPSLDGPHQQPGELPELAPGKTMKQASSCRQALVYSQERD